MEIIGGGGEGLKRKSTTVAVVRSCSSEIFWGFFFREETFFDGRTEDRGGLKKEGLLVRMTGGQEEMERKNQMFGL